MKTNPILGSTTPAAGTSTAPSPATAILSATGLLLAILTSASPLASAQTDDRSPGAVLDSPTSLSAPPDPNPPPKKLIAVLKPAIPDTRSRGDVSFSLSGTAINVNGRVEGLEAGKSFQLVMTSPADKRRSGNAASSEKRPSGTGPPDAGPPIAGAPAPPAADVPDAGKPDGKSRPGTPGGGEGTTVTGDRNPRWPSSDAPRSADRVLQTFTADTNGTSNISATVPLPISDEVGLDSIVGHILLLMRPAQGNPLEQPALIATGTVMAPDVPKAIPVETVPRIR